MSEEGSDELPPRPNRRIQRLMVVSSSSGSDSDETLVTSRTRRKRIRVVSDDATSDSSGSSLVGGIRRKRCVPLLRDSEADSDDAKIPTSVPSTSKNTCGFSSDSSEGNSDKCSICLLRFTTQEIGTPANCDHIFCLDCITEWSKNVNTCPVDRITFDSILVRGYVGGCVLRTQPVSVVERPPSVDILMTTVCQICAGAEDEHAMLLCDGCDLGYHLHCLTPPLAEVPTSEHWFCPSCDIFDTMDRWLGYLSGEASDVELAPRPFLQSYQRFASATERVVGGTGEAPTTSRGRRVGARGGSRRARSTRPRRRGRRVLIEYDVQDDGKIPVTRKVTKTVRKRKSKRRARTVARRSHVQQSVRARLATLRAGAGRSEGRFSPPLGSQRLSLFGDPHRLEHFSDDEPDASGPTAALAAATRPTSAILNAYRQARRKMIPSPPRATTAPDILSAMLDSQALLHSSQSVVSVAIDGSVHVKLQKSKKLPSKSRDTSKQDYGKKVPSYPGQSRGGGGGWGGGYRGSRPRDGADNFGRGNYDHGHGGPRARQPGGHRGHSGSENFDFSRPPHRFSPGDAYFDRRRRHSQSGSDGARNIGPGARPDPGQGRFSSTWQPFDGPAPPPPTRHSFGGFENPLDMRMGQVPPRMSQSECGARLDALPAPDDRQAPSVPRPPSFSFSKATELEKSEDEKSDPGLVIDTDKYDPTEPTRDDDSGDERSAISPAPRSGESVLAGIDVPPDVLDSAVRQVLREHRSLIVAPPDRAPSEGDSDGDCPNFSIYSATSVHIANSTGGLPDDAPPVQPSQASHEGMEDLVQEDGAGNEAAEPSLPAPTPLAPPNSVKSKTDEYKEKISKRCPITTNTRNPIKIKLNAPSLIKRVSLYDDEDLAKSEENTDVPLEETSENPPSPTFKKEQAKLFKNEEGAAQTRQAPNDIAAQKGRSDPEAEPGVTPVKGGRNVGKCEGKDRSQPKADNVGELNEAADQPPMDTREDDNDEKMTESISEAEDERSYTPCLDENKPGTVEGALEGLDTELISDEEGNDMFSEHERPASAPSQPLHSPDEPKQESPQPPPSPPAADKKKGDRKKAEGREEGKKKKKKDSKKEGKEKTKSKKKPEVAFKKLSKSGKERNYREREKGDRKKRDRRSSSEPDTRKRRKEKRKDLERYDVRTRVGERRRHGKDPFGRDVRSLSAAPSAPRRSPSPRSPSPARKRRRRSGSRPRRKRSVSPSPRRSNKRKKRTRSERSPSRRRADPSPIRRRSPSLESPPPRRPRTSPTPSIDSQLLSPRTPPEPQDDEPRRRREPALRRRPRDAPPPSKEVFTSGDNILVSVSFKEQERNDDAERRRRRESKRARRHRRRAPPGRAPDAVKPVAIIDLERSPFRELTPSPKNVIVLSDSDPGERDMAEAPAPPAPAAEPIVGPKTPPEPQEEPLVSGPEAPAAPAAHPTEQAPEPSSPDAYDPFEPTRSASASPAAPEPAPTPPRPTMTLEAAQRTNLSADEVLDRRPLSPAEKVLALLQSTREASPEAPPAEPPQPTPGPLAPRIVLPAPPKLFPGKPSPIKSNPVKPMARPPSAGPSPGASPYSPGSSDFGDLFEPHDSFEAIVHPRRSKNASAKVPAKVNKKKGKTQVGVKLDDDNLKILDELPSSAVEMQVKSKFLKKLNRQERVVEEVKLVLKPHYNKKHVTKEEYKHILRRAVPKVCHNKTGEINPAKIQSLVEAYVHKFRKRRKLGLA